jgi:EKC/KEOPS complex subunit CGI121/TPRKB
MQSGKLEPEVAFLNASLVRSDFLLMCSASLTVCSVYRGFSWVTYYALFHKLQVPDVFPVLAAAHKSLLSKARESLTTRTLHSELVYNISGSKHVISLADVAFAFYDVALAEYVDGFPSVQIRESLKRCGVSDDTKYILAARFDASDEEVKHFMCTITYWVMVS